MVHDDIRILGGNGVLSVELSVAADRPWMRSMVARGLGELRRHASWRRPRCEGDDCRDYSRVYCRNRGCTRYDGCMGYMGAS